jgi:ComF family protein
MAPAVASLLPRDGSFTLVPVPLGQARQRERGYNQSELLARAVGARVRAPVSEAVLLRSRETARQTGLTPGGRQVNVSGAFTAGRPITGAAILVDDVFTTGATLVAAASALLNAGAARVEAVTFARARRPLDDEVEHLPADSWRQPSNQL